MIQKIKHFFSNPYDNDMARYNLINTLRRLDLYENMPKHFGKRPRRPGPKK